MLNKEEENKFECKCNYAFWRVKEIIDVLLNLGNTDDIRLEDVYFDHNALLILTSSVKFPGIFLSKEEELVSGGSFRTYVTTLAQCHSKLLRQEHLFLYLKYPVSHDEFRSQNTVHFPKLLEIVPPPIYYRDDDQLTSIQLSHLYLSFNKGCRNALLLRKCNGL